MTHFRGNCPTCGRILGLTKRQWLISNLIYEGLSDKEIAIKNDLTTRAVRSAVERIRIALGLTFCSRGQLIFRIKELREQRAKLDLERVECNEVIKPRGEIF